MTTYAGGKNGHFSRVWYIGERFDTLRVIDAYKFENVFAASATLVELLHNRIGQLSSSIIITSLPTLLPMCGSADTTIRGFSQNNWHVCSTGRQNNYYDAPQNCSARRIKEKPFPPG